MSDLPQNLKRCKDMPLNLLQQTIFDSYITTCRYLQNKLFTIVALLFNCFTGSVIAHLNVSKNKERIQVNRQHNCTSYFNSFPSSMIHKQKFSFRLQQEDNHGNLPPPPYHFCYCLFVSFIVCKQKSKQIAATVCSLLKRLLH